MTTLPTIVQAGPAIKTQIEMQGRSCASVLAGIALACVYRFAGTASHTRDSSAFLLTLPQEWVRILVTCEGEFDAGGSQLP